MIISRSIQVTANDIISFLFRAELYSVVCVYVCGYLYIYIYVYITFSLSIHLLMDRLL